MSDSTKIFETKFLVLGSGMGGMAAGSLLARDGLKPVVLEAAHVPGGCSSSYKRKGYIFESGATTLIGFDEKQPLWKLEKELGIDLPKKELLPSMAVHIDGEPIIRYKDRDEWIKEAGRVFGNPEQQRKFWKEAFKVADVVWEASGKNVFFPPRKLHEWLRMAVNNNPVHLPVLRHAFRSVQSTMKSYKVDTPKFRRFIDEQLMITAQAKSPETPFLFGAPAITYTNYRNFYVDGGLLEMVRVLENYLTERGGEVKCRRKVVSVEALSGTGYRVKTANGEEYLAEHVISNIPSWNLKDMTDPWMRTWFKKQSDRFSEAWGAITMGVVTSDEYADDLPLHHQLHLPEGKTVPFTNSESVFVSMSMRGDHTRAPEGKRVLNVSTHANTKTWFEMNGSYDQNKAAAEEFILDHLNKTLPGFSESEFVLAHTATPVTWQNWVYRKEGRVGGIPQQMSRSVLDWTPAETPFKGFWLCGDTVYPGQGIPAVTLSGINVYYRIKHDLNF